MKPPKTPPEPPPPRYRVFLVDDHSLIRRGLTSIINQEKDLVVCGEACGPSGTLNSIRQLDPHVAIVDLVLPDGSGLDLIKQLKSLFPRLLILVLSMHPETTYAERVLRAGASGYVMKQEASDKILAALRCVLQGDIFLSETMKEKLLHNLINGSRQKSALTIDRLSDRELEVLHLVGSGFSSRQIAGQLKLSVKTIETHRANLRHKLQLANGAALVQYAIQWNRSEGKPLTSGYTPRCL